MRFVPNMGVAIERYPYRSTLLHRELAHEIDGFLQGAWWCRHPCDFSRDGCARLGLAGEGTDRHLLALFGIPSPSIPPTTREAPK